MVFCSFGKEEKLSISLEATEECSGYFDVDKLDKIIYNLLSNAAKYTPEGGAITLCQSYDEETGLLKITVNNPGECIPEENWRICSNGSMKVNIGSSILLVPASAFH